MIRRTWSWSPARPRLPAASPGSGSPTPGTGAIATVSIARALKITDRAVAIDATVTAPATLLDASGRRIVVQDASAAVELLLPTGSAAPPVGTRIHAEGRIGVAYGAPRLRVDRFAVSGTGSVPAPLVLHGMPGAAHEWRLVTVSGRVLSVNKLGDRWRAEIAVGNDHVVVVGQPGAGIPSTTMVEGRTATVTGIARRPAPTASDHRFAVTPRFPADVRVTGASRSQDRTAPRPAGGRDNARRLVRRRRDRRPSVPAAPDADLDDLARFTGRLVRVGGLVVDLRPDGFTLDDGTAIGRIVLRGAALELLPMIEPDDALNAIGRVEALDGGFVVVVDDPGGIILAGDPVAAGGLPLASRAKRPAAIERERPRRRHRDQPARRLRRSSLAGRCRRCRCRHAARDLGAVGGRDAAAEVPLETPFGGPDRLPAGLVRDPEGRRRRPDRG